MKLAEIRKVVAYVLGLAAQLVAMGLVPTPVLPVVSAVIAVATGLGIYQAKNEPAA
jgi:hypothetical protein